MLFLLLGTASCMTNTSNQLFSQLDANSFNKKWESEKQNSLMIDVRTPEEYKSGHIKGAVNIDYNDADFQSNLNKLDKNKTIFVYCLSGGRSSSAVSVLKDLGFTKVFELNGGMMNWRASGLTEEKGVPKKSTSNLSAILSKNDLVLIDFYADWCAPCKKMKPILNDLSKETSILVAPMNADIEQDVVNQYQIMNLPTLILIKNGKEVWRGEGIHSKEQLIEIIQKFK